MALASSVACFLRHLSDPPPHASVAFPMQISAYPGVLVKVVSRTLVQPLFHPTTAAYTSVTCASPDIVLAKGEFLWGRPWCGRGDRGITGARGRGGTRSMFVDYLTVIMVAVVPGAVLTVVYGLMFLDAPLADQKPWGWAFAVVGLLLAVTGLHLVLTWPLPGAYNIVMGEPALYFGLVFLGTAFAVRAGEV